MGFTVRLMLGTFLVLICFWSVQTAALNRSIRQVSRNESQTTEKLQEIQAETTTRSNVANLTEDNSKPKTDFTTEDNKTIDKQNVVGTNLQKSEPKAAVLAEIARSLDIDKYVSKDFHNKNNVYTLPTSSDTEKFIDPDFDYHATTHKHESYTEDFDYHAELTTPKSSFFDDRFKDTVESFEQKLEHIDIDSHETSAEADSKENPDLNKLFEETKKNDTEAKLSYLNYKNVINNDTTDKNAVHEDLLVESGRNLNFESSFNHTTVIDEDDGGNNTIVKDPDQKKKVESSTLSNVILTKGDLENAETSTSKSGILTTRKSNILTKPPSNRNSSHLSILSNNIETETVKAINIVHSTTTEKSKGETETVPELIFNKTPIVVAKRPFTLAETRTEAAVDTNNINKKSEQLLQENQVIPIHVEAPPVWKNTTEPLPILENITNINEDNDPSTTTISPTVRQNINSTIGTVFPRSTEAATLEPQTTTTPSNTEVATTTNQPTTETFANTESTSASETESSTVVVPETTIISVIHEDTTRQPETTEFATMTSVITETSVSPWTKVTTAPTVAVTKTSFSFEIRTTKSEEETTTSISESEGTTVESASTTLSSTENEATTTDSIPTIETVLNTNTEIDSNGSSTTEDPVRISKEMVYKDVTTPLVPAPLTEESSTESATAFEQQTTEPVVDISGFETTQVKIEEVETTTQSLNFNHSGQVVPDLRSNNTFTEVENSTENNTITSDFYEIPEPPEDNSGTIAAITISSIGAVCLILLAGLLVIMRKRQKRFNYGQRCTPVSLDDYSMDNVSVYNNSVRRKVMIRGSKRSYGNPAFEDPVCVSHPLNFPALGRFANNLEDIRAEFEEIPQITARTNELPEGCDTKNRYANVIPLPETRVFLNLLDGHPNSDYINANYVTGPKNTKGYYIACQAPLQNTVDDFWRMIWEQQCKVVLMLTHLFENGVEKCIDYLPPSEVLDCHRLFGDFQVTLKKREVKDKYIISSLQLKNMVSNSWREVTHFWYLGWPEKGIPSEANSLIAFLIEARSYMKSSSLDRKDVTNGNLTNGITKNELNPVVVHCSPGTGRTGVVIACDIAIREFEQTRLIDVPKIVYKIRRDRASSVQTKEQYAFIYKVINLYATKLTGGAFDSL